jgi:hypothetical protein
MNFVIPAKTRKLARQFSRTLKTYEWNLNPSGLSSSVAFRFIFSPVCISSILLSLGRGCIDYLISGVHHPIVFSVHPPFPRIDCQPMFGPVLGSFLIRSRLADFISI